MPFTLSHPAAVLLLGRTELPVAAMVSGSMVPDVPLFVRVRGAYGVTHSLLGVVTVDLVLGVFGVVVWFGLVRDALVDVAPSAVRERLAATARYSRRQWRLVPFAVVAGALSHVVWDLFTHPHRWGSDHVGWLRSTHGGLVGSAWAQYASGVIGAVVVVAWAVDSVRRRSRRARPRQVPQLGTTALVVVVLATGVVAGIAFVTAASGGLHAMGFHAAIVGTTGLAIGLLALAGVWRSWPRRALSA